MSDQQQPSGMVLPNGTVEEDPALVTNVLLGAIRIMAENARSDPSAGEAKDYAAAALAFAQTVITLDPSRLAGGDTPQARRASMPEPAPARAPTRDGDRDGRIGS